MKRFLIFVVFAVVCFLYVENKNKHQREQLIGVWQMNRSAQGADMKMTMDIKPGGPVTLGVDASKQGRSVSKALTGTWTCEGSKFYIQFDKGDIPGHDPSEKFGGPIQTLDDKTFSYQAKSGIETWTRAH